MRKKASINECIFDCLHWGKSNNELAEEVSICLGAICEVPVPVVTSQCAVSRAVCALWTQSNQSFIRRGSKSMNVSHVLELTIPTANIYILEPILRTKNLNHFTLRLWLKLGCLIIARSLWVGLSSYTVFVRCKKSYPMNLWGFNDE